MPGIKRKKCRHCHILFVPDPRNRDRQKYCHRPECRKASKAASQKNGSQKPDNRDYFRGSGECATGSTLARRQPWILAPKTENHPDALQDPLNPTTFKTIDNNTEFANHALQDLLTRQPSV
jgi:hypothetical protein